MSAKTRKSGLHSIEAGNTFGLQLVATLADQLEGNLTVNRERGVAFTISFPLQTEPPTFLPPIGELLP